MKFTMMKEDIEKGVHSTISACPVALCIKRQTRARKVRVFQQEIMIGRKWVDAPTKINFFIQRFDQGEKVRPITFELDY